MKPIYSCQWMADNVILL